MNTNKKFDRLKLEVPLKTENADKKVDGEKADVSAVLPSEPLHCFGSMWGDNLKDDFDSNIEPLEMGFHDM